MTAALLSRPTSKRKGSAFFVASDSAVHRRDISTKFALKPMACAFKPEFAKEIAARLCSGEWAIAELKLVEAFVTSEFGDQPSSPKAAAVLRRVRAVINEHKRIDAT